MLKVNISETSVSVIAAGDVKDITCECAVMFAGLHAQLKGSNPKLASEFRINLIRMLVDPESPVWTLPASEAGVTIVTPDIKKGD